MLKLLKFRILLVLLILVPFNVFAQTSEDFIKTVTQQASSILMQNISKEQKSQELIELAKTNVDIRAIGLYTLGKHKKNISEDQLKEFEELFYEYFLKTFSSRLSEYSDPKINVISQKIINEKYTIVSSILVADEKRPEIEIDWRVYTKNPDKLVIRDLIIGGLSLARMQREEFGSVIQSSDGDINILFNNLREFNNK